MRITVCELPDDAKRRESAWADLTGCLRDSPTDILLLPEMPFVDWAVFTNRTVDPATWQQILRDHDAMIARFAELDAKVVLGSRPIADGDRRLNQAFAWTRADGY